MKAYRSLTASPALWSLVVIAAAACGRSGQRADAGADIGSTVGSGGTTGAGGAATAGAGGGALGGSPGSGGANAGGGGQASGGAAGAGGHLAGAGGVAGAGGRVAGAGGAASAGGAGPAGGAGGAGASGGSVIDAGPEVQTVRKRVFHLVNGALGKIKDSSASDTRTGLETADAACTTAGKMHGGGQWQAWLSSSSMNAIDRLADVGPWYRLDQQTMLFENRAAIAQGPLVPIDDPADGNSRISFWSGTLLDGTASAANCADWTEYVGGVKATVGRADTAGPGWVAPTLQSCSTYLALLCFEQ